MAAGMTLRQLSELPAPLCMTAPGMQAASEYVSAVHSLGLLTPVLPAQVLLYRCQQVPQGSPLQRACCQLLDFVLPVNMCRGLFMPVIAAWVHLCCAADSEASCKRTPLLPGC